VAKDIFHDVVKRALQKEGWQITHDPFALKVGTVEMFIDLGAERLLGAERDGTKIAVEIKSFLANASAISEFHTALGQFINYRAALKLSEPERILFLARISHKGVKSRVKKLRECNYHKASSGLRQ
jgi:XisH protein